MKDELCNLSYGVPSQTMLKSLRIKIQKNMAFTGRRRDFVSIQCTNCGQTLPRDNARFCSNCGTYVSTDPHSPQPLSSPKDAPILPGEQAHKNRSVLREQRAKQPSFQPPRRPRSEQDDPPPWISQLNTLEHSKASPAETEADRLAGIPTISLPGGQKGQAFEVEPLTKKDDESLLRAQVDKPLERQVPPKSPVRELHIKVWEQEEPLPTPLPEKFAPAPAKEEKAAVRRDENIIADIPTVVVEWTNGQARPSMPLPMPGMQTPRFYTSTPPFEQPATQPAQQPGLSQKPSSSAFVPPARRPKRLVPLLFTIVLLCSFGAVVFWAYVFQPFSIPPVTQPQQSFQNAGLGVALSYPNGWTVQVDQNNGIAHFSDSTHTARFSIGVVASNGQDASQYLLQEAKQLGMIAPKPGPPLSFAKASWQQVQGSVVQNGANYTEALLMTTHAGRLYSVIQQAPQATYADEDQVIFSTMRSSFKFLL